MRNEQMRNEQTRNTRGYQRKSGRRPGRLVALWVVLLLALVLSSCSAPAQNVETSAPLARTEPTATPVAVKPSDGPLAPDWMLETLGGGQFHLADHEGEVVVMYFMASWCASCIPEARSLEELYQRYKEQGLTVVAINVEPDKKVAELSRFRQLANNAAYAWTFDTAYAVTQQYGVKALDTTFIIDRSGHIAYSDAYPTPLDVLDAEIQKWL